MAVITQNLTVLRRLLQVKPHSADVITLYNTFNAQTIPDTIGVCNCDR